jgi:hypothetical protein
MLQAWFGLVRPGSAWFGLVRPEVLTTRFAMGCHLAPARPFGRQSKAFFAIEAVDNIAT